MKPDPTKEKKNINQNPKITSESRMLKKPIIKTALDTTMEKPRISKAKNPQVRSKNSRPQTHPS